LNIGFHKNPNKNPATVYVSMDYDSNEVLWPQVIADLESYLAEFPYGLAWP